MDSEFYSLPQDIEAEQAVLGAILIDSSSIEKIIELLSSRDFYKTAHQKIYDAMLGLHDENKPIDLLTLYDHLRSKGTLIKEVGESSYLTYLTELVPVSDNIIYYAKMVKEVSRKREICLEAEDVSYLIRKGDLEVERAMERFSNKLEAISQSTPSNGLDFINSEELIQGDYESIEWYVEGLLPKSSVILLAASPGNFKTWFSLSLASYLSRG